jgi:arylsulfatase A-like enzyme
MNDNTSPLWRHSLAGLMAIWLLVGSPRTLHAQQPRQATRPNIVFLLADDLRWDALGCMGNRIIQTPNLDALAKRGVLFRNAFVTTSICAVSRASILTGQYARRHKINDFKTDLSPEAFARTYVALLRAAGYRVGFIGKYGVGVNLPAVAFDYWRGFPGQGSYFTKKETVHLTRRMGDQALEFLKAQDRKTPFCLSVSFKSPHAMDRAAREFPPDPRDEKLYEDATIPVPKTADDRYFKALPEFVQQSEGRARWQLRFATAEQYQKVVRDYYRLITGMDREIGRIVAALEQLGLSENTIIIFSSDNGFFLGERGMADKWLMYEESIRVPLIVCDPRLPARERGRAVAAMALNIDLAPTMLDYAGLAVPKTMQGRSLRPLVEGKTSAWRTDWLYEHHTLPKIIPSSEGVRTERWTYLRWMAAQPAIEELYDLQNDPLQERNLAAVPEHRATLLRLRARWEQLRKEVEGP